MSYTMTLTVKRKFIWGALEMHPDTDFCPADVSLYQLLDLVNQGVVHMALSPTPLPNDAVATALAEAAALEAEMRGAAEKELADFEAEMQAAEEDAAAALAEATTLEAEMQAAAEDAALEAEAKAATALAKKKG
jgi:hypothetical protein